MRKMTRLALILSPLLLAACAGGARSSDDEGPSILKVPEEDVPDQVKAIETQINQKGALVADEVEIHCSRNYEWDVSLVGRDVTPQRPDGSEQVSVATGKPRAMFRKLDIRAYKRIVFRKSGFDVVPFIRITAKGHATYVAVPEQGKPSVRRASQIRIRNADIEFINEQAGPRPRALGGAAVAGGGL